MAFQLLTCVVAVAGDQNQKVSIGPHRPITYPEYLILAHLHGESAIYRLATCGEVERENAEERNRLMAKYGKNVVHMLYPGVAGRLPQGDPNIPPYEMPGEDTKGKSRRKKAAPKPAPVETTLEEPPLAVEEEIAKEA